jgi:hypothetical protein
MPDSVYVLERLNWRAAVPRGLWLALPGADPLATFPDRPGAEALAREREWAVRRRVNPFRCGGPFLHYQTSFDAARLHDWFLDLGLVPPEPTTDSAAWAAAWELGLPQMTDAQRAAAWEVLDRVRFFRVVERPAGRRMRLVAEAHLEEDPVTFPRSGPRYVGSTPYMLVRRRETADALCHQLYVDRLAKEGEYTGHPTDPGSWEGPDEDPFAELDQPELAVRHRLPLQFAEHRPLDLITTRDPTPGHTVYVVLRRHWRLELTDADFWRWSLTQTKTCGRAVAAFDTLAAADALIAELEAEARRYPSPFRFGPPHEWGTLHGSGIWGVLDNLAPVEFANAWADYTAPDRLWARWWDEAVPGLTADEIATAWGLYDRLKFYEVVAVEYRE